MLQNTRLGCLIQVDVFREHTGCVHDVSLSWQVSPEPAETYFLPTGLTYGSTVLKLSVLKLSYPQIVEKTVS